MNICFFIGRICSEIEFDFILNGKNTSIAIFNVELLNGSIIKVKGYNEMADYCYSSLENGMIIQIQGYINSKYEIILQDIEIIMNKFKGENVENNNLKLKIDKQIKELIEKINSNNSKEEIKGSQIMLNKLLNEYLKEK